MNDGRLCNHTIVVVGGTSGLGLAGAKACIAAGACVVIVGHCEDEVESAVRKLGAGARGVVGDATCPETVPRAIECAMREFGSFTGLYHVAGGSGRRAGDGPLHELSDEGWRYTLNVNLTSMMLSNRAAVRQFLKQGSGGSILNMGSTLGYSPAPHFFATHAYAAAKSAVIGLTRAAAAYYANQNIRFNVIAPALVETPMSQRACSDPEILSYIASKQPLDGGRIGQPADLDAAVVYFLSDESCFTTGQVLAVDGGWSITDGQIPEKH